MIDPVELAGPLIWGTLIGLLVRHQVWAHRARRWREAGACTRCGGTLLVNPGESGEAQAPTMCVECQRRTQRNYRAGSWFFYAVAAFFAAMAPLVIISEFRQLGLRTALLDAALFAGLIGLTAGAGWAIRYFGRRVG